MVVYSIMCSGLQLAWVVEVSLVWLICIPLLPVPPQSPWTPWSHSSRGVLSRPALPRPLLRTVQLHAVSQWHWETGERGGGRGEWAPTTTFYASENDPRTFFIQSWPPPVYIHSYHLVIMHRLHNHVYFVMSVAQYNSRHKFQVAFMYILTYCIALNPVVHKFLSFFTETTRCKSGWNIWKNQVFYNFE